MEGRPGKEGCAPRKECLWAQEYIPVLERTRLFAGVDKKEIGVLLSCLQARRKQYAKGEYVLRQGEQIHQILLLAKGSLLIQQDDYWGNRSIVSRIGEGEIFAEAYAASGGETLPHDVAAVEESMVLFLDLNRIFAVCLPACRFHRLVLENLFFAISEKNRGLVQKLGYLSRRSIREKLLAYLSWEAGKKGGPSFSIPFNRQQLADYLAVDRSAMSRELCRMRDEGLIRFERNRFTLLQPADNFSSGW